MRNIEISSVIIAGREWRTIMRAIDADHLRRWILSRVFKTQLSVADVIDQIDREDTIEPERKTGEWIWMGEQGDSRFMCSVCKSKENVPTIMGKPDVWWFCPDCGADMRR